MRNKESFAILALVASASWCAPGYAQERVRVPSGIACQMASYSEGVQVCLVTAEYDRVDSGRPFFLKSTEVYTVTGAEKSVGRIIADVVSPKLDKLYEDVKKPVESVQASVSEQGKTIDALKATVESQARTIQALKEQLDALRKR